MNLGEDTIQLTEYNMCYLVLTFFSTLYYKESPMLLTITILSIINIHCIHFHCLPLCDIITLQFRVGCTVRLTELQLGKSSPSQTLSKALEEAPAMCSHDQIFMCDLQK